MLTTDKKPFFAATYILRKSGSGRVGLLDLIPRFRDIWKERYDDIPKTAVEMVSVITQDGAD